MRRYQFISNIVNCHDCLQALTWSLLSLIGFRYKKEKKKDWDNER